MENVPGTFGKGSSVRLPVQEKVFIGVVEKVLERVVMENVTGTFGKGSSVGLSVQEKVFIDGVQKVFSFQRGFQRRC